jgi:hypothetical protein
MPQLARDKVSSPEASRPLPKKQKEPWDMIKHHPMQVSKAFKRQKI